MLFKRANKLIKNNLNKTISNTTNSLHYPTFSYPKLNLLQIQKPNSYNLNLLSSSFGIPKLRHNNNIVCKASDFTQSVGEDAILNYNNTIGIADGISSWNRKKLGNSKYYSINLLMDIINELKNSNNLNFKKLIYQSILKTNLKANLNKILGSSTLLIANLYDNLLNILNIGDCKILIIRNNQIAFKTEEQNHSFNYPYQVGNNIIEFENDIQNYKFRIQLNDIIIIGSDGLFDNLFEEEILEIVNNNNDSKYIAESLALRAKQVAYDTSSSVTPFQTKAQNEGLYYQGGKPDDISVLVSLISDKLNS